MPADGSKSGLRSSEVRTCIVAYGLNNHRLKAVGLDGD